MATDVDVQYFSHLNGLTLGNNWGDLIRLLDKALVTGIDFPEITAVSIDAQGDIHITLYAAHNAMLLQVVELSGFTPETLNQKYRVKGTPSATELILKPHAAIVETNIATVGSGKLASLGYEIIFRDTNDVKRVYRAKNPRAEHPFIRVDETISDGVNSYNSSYAKSAMVGLIENMTHINDYQDPNKLQLPLDTNDFSKNWKITGTDTGVVRGWSKWYWACNSKAYSYNKEETIPSGGNRKFSLIGGEDFFFLPVELTTNDNYKIIYSCGLLNANSDYVTPAWFLSAALLNIAASTQFSSDTRVGGSFCQFSEPSSKFSVLKNNASIASSIFATPILKDYESGHSNVFSGSFSPALEIPAFDSDNILRGTIPCMLYSGKNLAVNTTTPIMSDNSMYVYDCAGSAGGNIGGFYFYMGELK